MGRKDLLNVEKYTKYRRAEHIDEINGGVRGWHGGHEKSKVVAELRDAEAPCASVKTIAELINDPHPRHRQMLNSLLEPI